MLQQKIKDDIKVAMKARETEKLEVLRGILAAFTNELIAQKRKPADELSDEEAVLVIQKLAKQRKDSIEQYRAGGREDLAEAEKKELKYIKAYLPQMMARDEIKKLALTKQTEMSLTDPSKKGMLMGALMKDLKGKAEGGDVKGVVDEMFE
ncbi:MAG: GatB/YqeY domain-containing protein [Candidatus Pacebacteria bacterium]|nr:GatB/YqeY domain-containing protein [Candidatus Paceibacterota bacterium]